jgi:catechol 2,3-dioxygenase-like lactoylglutathione lyase family enzyme
VLRNLAPRLARLILLSIAALPLLLAAQTHVLQVGPVVMTVADMDRSVDFYIHVLMFQKQGENHRRGPEIDELYGVPNARVRAVQLKLGDESLELIQFIGAPGIPIPGDSRSNDLSFQHVAIIVSDMDRAYAILRQNHVEQISPYPQRLPDWNPNASGITAFYFRDPDGHPLEILKFPAGKGDPKWQAANGRLFLGIDHTAIVVANTQASLEFYRNLLGLHVAGESDNYGFEQEHLNNVFGAHLRITSLRSSKGIGIEFLEYITPRDGRPASAKASATDISHHETVLLVDDIAAVNAGWMGAKNHGVFVKQVGDSELLFHESQAELIHDPDGHPLLLLQR